MAIIRLAAPSWSYDTVAKTFLLIFPEPLPKSEPDPINWFPQFDYQVTLPVTGTVSKVPHVDPNA